MARPRSFDAEAFLDQSLDVFWQQGFAATSMADIYEATGLGASSIYAFVKDKDDLFRRVFERYVDGFRKKIPANTHGAAALEGWLHHFAQALGCDPVRKGCLIANTIMERSAHSKETLNLAKARVEEIRAWFQAQIERGQHDGDYHAVVDPHAASYALVATVLGMMAMARGHVAHDTLLQVADSATAALRIKQD